MSLNNLAEQLSWLLSSKLFTPPAVHTIQASRQHLDAAIDEATLAPFYAPRNDSEIKDSDVGEIDIVHEAAVLQSEQEAEMARLRAAPTPTRQRMLSHKHQHPPATSSSSRNDAEHTSEDESAAMAISGNTIVKRKVQNIVDFHVLSNPSPIAKRAALLPQPISNVQTPSSRSVGFLDLTGDADDALIPSTAKMATFTASPTAGRKRKSGESICQIERKTDHHLTSGPIQNGVCGPEGFANIDDFSDPPPPYSTTPAVPKIGRSDQDEFLDIQDDIRSFSQLSMEDAARPKVVPNTNVPTEIFTWDQSPTRFRSPTESPEKQRVQKVRKLVHTTDRIGVPDNTPVTLPTKKAVEEDGVGVQDKPISSLQAVNSADTSLIQPLSTPGNAEFGGCSRLGSSEDQSDLKQVLEKPLDALLDHRNVLMQEFDELFARYIDLSDDPATPKARLDSLKAQQTDTAMKVQAIKELISQWEQRDSFKTRWEHLVSLTRKQFLERNTQDTVEVQERQHLKSVIRNVEARMLDLARQSSLMPARFGHSREAGLELLRSPHVKSTQVPLSPTKASASRIVSKDLFSLSKSPTATRFQRVEQTQSHQNAGRQAKVRPSPFVDFHDVAPPSSQSRVAATPTKTQQTHQYKFAVESSTDVQDYPDGRGDYHSSDSEYGHVDNDADFLDIVSGVEHRGRFEVHKTIPRRPGVLTERSNNAAAKSSPDHRKKAGDSQGAVIGMDRPWSNDVKAAMKTRFRMRGFRHHQLDAINATLNGEDAFVLMPTGGGKSLCFQLPAIIKSGRTKGVTIVISPLLSLMEDQINHLRRLNIKAMFINSESTADEKRSIMDALRGSNVTSFVELLYLTPEMVNKNQRLIDTLVNLHTCQRLARIVIDEAHCVSQWGHDFRPDYKNLGEFRQKFKGVPLMALTATATENVKADVINQLSMENCKVFTQSFNRPNLSYEVRKKGKEVAVLNEIAEIIQDQYANQSGIVYCLSRKKCESVAEILTTQHNISAHHYHAGLPAAEKKQIQQDWQRGRHQVIVATIAFGMGIDKPDVRFVIHHSVPKSLEGYYQETGRAGRDGKRSGCILFFGYQDVQILNGMIDKGDGDDEQKKRQKGMLRAVQQFADNKADCRRVQVLQYFNEIFAPEDCDGTCDNCKSKSVWDLEDYSDVAKCAIRLVAAFQGKDVTILHCVDVLCGKTRASNTKLDAHEQDEFYGRFSKISRNDMQRLFHRLLAEEAVREVNKASKKGFMNSYIKPGAQLKSQDIINGVKRIQLNVCVNEKSPVYAKTASRGKISNSAAAASKKKTLGKARELLPQSTNVSSPVQHVSHPVRKRAELLRAWSEESDAFEASAALESPPRKRISRSRTHNGNLLAESESADEWLPDAADESERIVPLHKHIEKAQGDSRAKSRVKGRQLNHDEQMERLNPLHRDIVEEFLREARKICRNILIERGLREHPFTDTMLREMAVSFPLTKDAMRDIPGIDPDKVELHGHKFLPLITKTERHYQEIMNDVTAEQTYDPNHHTVIDLVSDEERELDAGIDHDDMLDDLHDDDFDDVDEEISGYFPQRTTTPNFGQFVSSQQHVPNRNTALGRQGSGPPNRRKSGAGQKSSSPKRVRKSWASKARGARAGGSRKPRTSGVQKRRANAVGNNSSRGASAPRNGIGMMPV